MEKSEILFEHVLVLSPQSTRRALNALGSWLQEGRYPSTLNMQVLIRPDGLEVTVRTSRTSEGEAISDELLVLLKAQPW